ncbi:MAG: sporulation protein [Desulfovibrio sp.]|nr:sporulation protein [Desulfovibrio sp.]|tara:strand:- start:572 stop:1276 length:705 start_codon:yes stop_codon:yes gene_type:complete
MADKDGPKVKIPKLKATNKTYDFSLTLPGMISAVGAGVLALTFFFVMGILIGRGYRPEADVPQLQEIMPSKQHGEIAEGSDKPEILKLEELEYPDRLKEEPGKVMEVQKPKAAEPQNAEPKKVASKPEPKVEKPENTSPPKPAEVEQPATGEKVYSYVYQVASFRKPEMAETLSAKLVKDGLRSAIESGSAKGSTWYRVVVHHHGTPSSTANMKAVLEKYGINKPLLKKKVEAQ